MSGIKTLLGILLFVGVVAIVIILAVVLTRNYGDECGDLPTLDHISRNVTAYEDRLEIEWSVPPSDGLCKIIYSAVLTTDLDIYNIKSDEPKMVFSRELFCFSASLIVHAIIGSHITEIENTAWKYDVPDVQDVIVTTSNDIITASWADNPIDEQCGIMYEITFERENLIDRYRIHQTSITTPIIYCVDTTMSVKAIYGDIEGNDVSVIIEKIDPTTLDAVDGLSIETTDISAIVSWDVPRSLEKCINIYTVSAVNEETGEEAECQGTRNCELHLSSFCPSAKFTVKPTSPIEGNARRQVIEC